MEREVLPLEGAVIFKPPLFGDERGFFQEIYRKDLFETLLPEFKFVQENHSFSAKKYTLRGMHYQLPPHLQAKLVSCLRGSILDIIVDIRKDSPTFGKHATCVLSMGKEMLFVPRGFLHGFITLEENTQVLYKVDSYYAPQADRGIDPFDPTLNLPWPCLRREVFMSPKDATLPSFNEVFECASCF